MFIWSGLGFLVAVIAAVALVCTELLVEAVFQDGRYYQSHAWPKLFALWLAALAVWVLSNFLIRKRSRVLIDKETGEEVVLKPNHSLFFIRVDYWPYVLFGLGVVFFVIDLMKNQD